MELDAAMELGRRVLLMTLYITAPLMIVGLVVGVTVSLIQAVTQVQEMTLTFVPKVVAMVMATVILMPYIAQKVMTFATEMFSPMPVP
jgi:flagellar biosynthetic protein FliQ